MVFLNFDLVEVSPLLSGSRFKRRNSKVLEVIFFRLIVDVGFMSFFDFEVWRLYGTAWKFWIFLRVLIEG